MRLATQWVTSGMGGVTGLNYQSVEFLFKIYKVKNRLEMFENLAEIEAGAIEVFSRQREEKIDNASQL